VELSKLPDGPFLWIQDETFGLKIQSGDRTSTLHELNHQQKKSTFGINISPGVIDMKQLKDETVL
jgi:hypothetical protein